MPVFSDLPVEPAEAAGCLWCPLPLSTGLIASAGAIKGKKREDNARQFKAKHGKEKSSALFRTGSKQYQGNSTTRQKQPVF